MAALALPLLLVLPGLFRGLDGLPESRDVGTQYTSAAVQAFVASPVLDQVPDDCQVLTNDPWLLWLAGLEAQLSPESDREVAIPVSMRLEELAPMVGRGRRLPGVDGDRLDGVLHARAAGRRRVAASGSPATTSPRCTGWAGPSCALSELSRG